MAKSFKKRFGGKELEILHYINEQGGNPIACPVMEHYGAKDVIAWGRYVDAIALENNFKFAPVCHLNLQNYRPLDLQYLDECAGISSLTKLVARLQHQIARKKIRRDELERQLLEVIEDNSDYIPSGIRIDI